jgi:hypothetical protein
MSKQHYQLSSRLWPIILITIACACNPPRDPLTQAASVTLTPATRTSSSTAAVSASPTRVELVVTPTIEPLVTLTPLYTPSLTPDAMLWDAEPEYYGSIIITDQVNELIFLFQPGGTAQKSFTLEPRTYGPWMAESITADCHFVAMVRITQDPDWQHGLVQIDRNGEVVAQLFTIQMNMSDMVRFKPVLSPTGQYVSYSVYSGELYYDSAQYQDIELVNLAQPEQSVRLTSNGGAWSGGGAWSPDGSFIAYTDYDAQGFLQVFTTRLEDLTQQLLTDFRIPGFQAGGITWSPDGDRIAVIFESQDNKQEMWIVSVPARREYKLNTPDWVELFSDRMFWSEDGSKLLLSGGNYFDSNQSGLYWFDVEDNRLVHVLTRSDASEMNDQVREIAFPFPMTTDLSIVAFGGHWPMLYVYNSVIGQIEPLSGLNPMQWGTYLDVAVFQDDIFSCTGD